MEAVTRKLDFVLTGDTADLRAATAQRESLRRKNEQDRTGLVERVAADTHRSTTRRLERPTIHMAEFFASASVFRVTDVLLPYQRMLT